MRNTPIRKLRLHDGSPVKNEKGEQMYMLGKETITLGPGFNQTSFSPNKQTRRQFLQKKFRNIFFGIHVGSKYIQIIRDKVSGKAIKVIDHWPYNKVS